MGSPTTIKFTLEVTSPNKEDIVNFLRLCSWIQYLGNVGASRMIQLSVDGDGSAKLNFKVDGHKLPSPKDGEEVSGTGKDIHIGIGD